MDHCNIDLCYEKIYNRKLKMCKQHWYGLTKHGNVYWKKPVKDDYGTSHPLYKTWVNMKDRCYNKDARAYKYYGARGITVCEEWRTSFVKFVIDMGDKPAGYSLDRMNNDGNYEPSNCRWASRYQQAMNKRVTANNATGYRGVLEYGDKYRAVITMALGVYDTAEEAADAYKAAWTLLRGQIDYKGSQE